MSTTHSTEAILALLQHHLGGEVIQFEAEHGIFFDATFSGTPLHIALEIQRRRSLEDMKGHLALAILRSQQRATQKEGIPVALLYIPRASKRALAIVEDFIKVYASHMGWGVLDDLGAFYLQLPQRGIVIEKTGKKPAESSRHTTYNQQAFTDLNRWLLKILLLQTVPPPLWSGDQSLRQNINNPLDLHSVAQVSQAKAYQFARTFRSLGFLKWDRQNFAMIRHHALFELWYEHERQLQITPIPVRSIFGSAQDPLEIFREAKPEADYAIGGLAACNLHGVLHAQVSETLRIHVGSDYLLLLEELDLEICEAHQAEFALTPMPYPEAIFRATVQIEGLRVVDILQAAIDMAHLPARGREQAEYIVTNILGWT